MGAKTMLVIPVLLLAALLVGACTSAPVAASVDDVEQLRQQITTLQEDLHALRQENLDLKQQVAYQMRVISVILERVGPDFSAMLTARITGFEGHEGMKKPRLTVGEGQLVRIDLTNGENVEHDFIIDGMAHSSHLERAGDTATVVFVAGQAGEYTYYCSIPGHREAGMEGVLVVEPGQMEAGHEAH